jgi:DNA-binding IclR family transcriptional regulator
MGGSTDEGRQIRSNDRQHSSMTQIESERPASVRPADVPRASSDRVLLVFKALPRHPDGISLNELAAEVGLVKSSLHRALKALQRAALVEQDDRGAYRLSLDAVRLITDFYEGFDRRVRVTPALEALAARFDAAAHYAELIDAEVVYVAKVDPKRSGIRLSSAIGGRNPAHCTGVGKALLAHTLADDVAVGDFVADHGPLIRRTSRTYVAGDDLARELARTRRRGYAIDDRESEELVNCIAFPVYLTSSRRPTGAVSVTALVNRLGVQDLVAHAEEIRGIIETRLGPVTGRTTRVVEGQADTRSPP